ncbi:MAG: bifunctional metallophosphatase/5'-nucleotidase [bacterium]|nr:bifunctional metallophosphatase/5'-nucleotidase [bacterium]
MIPGKLTLKGLLVLFFAGLILATALPIYAAHPTAGNPASPASDVSDGEETRIVILHFNDLHARIDNLAKVAWLVAREREKNPNVFLMNAGDNFSGNPVVDQYVPKGEPILEIFKKLKIDVATLGNHDFDYGQTVLKNAMESAGYPMLCANVKVADSDIPQPEPYTILKTKNGIKIAVLGLLIINREDKLPSSHPVKLKGLTFSWPLDEAKKYTFLKKKSDIFVALTHLGAEVDERLAEQMGELDVIVGGHSHTTIKPPLDINGVMITQAGSYAYRLGRIELTFKNGGITEKKSELIDLKDVKNEEPEVKKMIAAFNNAPHLERVVATFPKKLAGKTELGNLITDGIRKVLQLDIAVHNSGGVRVYRLAKKTRLKNIYKMLPFDNDIVMFKMTVDEIKGLFKYDYTRHKKLDLKVSGIEYTILVGPDNSVRDVILRDNKGRLLDENKIYKIGMNNYIASSYKFRHSDPGKSFMTNAAQVIIDYLEMGGDIVRDLDKARTHKEEVKE